MTTSRLIAVALTMTVSTAAFAYSVTGFLTGQYQGQSAGGSSGTVCVYNVMGKDAHVFIGMGLCPLSLQFNQ